MATGARTMAHHAPPRRRSSPPPPLFLVLLLALVLSIISKQQTVHAQSDAQEQVLCLQQPNLPGCQSCQLPSFSPGCNDPTCKKRVCSALNQTQCCTRSWGLECAAVAQVLCFPEIKPWPLSTPCPNGFLCEESNNYGRRMSNCTDVQQLPQRLKLGNLFAGISCPENEPTLMNCPLGSYCPTPDVILPCPAGSFCPHKSAAPWITCQRCKEGSLYIQRDTFGYIFFSLVIVVLVLASFIMKHKEYQSNIFAKQLELLARQADSFNITKRRKLRQEQLDRLKPKLDILARRLEKTHHVSMSGKISAAPSVQSFSSSPAPPEETTMSSSTARSSSTPSNSHAHAFDTRKLYNVLDKDGNGKISYQELNAVLQLNQHELQNFVKRMRELGQLNDDHDDDNNHSNQEDTVSRSVFVKHFLHVLDETSQLSATTEEASALWDQIEEENGSKGYVDESMLYTSSISGFLNDRQIYVLIKKLRNLHHESSKHNSEAFSLERRTLKRQATVRSKNGNSWDMVDGKVVILRSIFSVHYPKLLVEVTTDLDESMAKSMRNVGHAYVDISFKDLSLAVQVAGKEINVVDHVTGRLQAQTMTALMGGSGCGKTSLLNALCGRAYYGDVLGEIYINGQQKDIREIADSVGFVPQDDIVYAELTVRENLIYTGKFLLPRGTQLQEIEELADETLASLGLSRVANSLVGDVKRRGVSGGEKKRVNIGLELMKRPAVLFLDEPTSGLDSSSALLVMSSLKHLVTNQGVTIVSVIHQPRKFIFDLFDSLILLGVGGKMVYHGPTSSANDYFYNLNYVLPQGESVADWLIDISSGGTEPAANMGSKKVKKTKTRTRAENDPTGQEIEVEAGAPDAEDDDAQGLSGGTTMDAFEAAKVRRAWLYHKWNEYYKVLSDEEKAGYEKPEVTKLPDDVVKQSFVAQLWNQTSRALLVTSRNATEKLIDTSVLVGATIVLCLMSKVPVMTRHYVPDIAFDDVVRPSRETIPNTMKELFTFAAVPQIPFPLKVGIITAVLMGLQSTKVLTNKRLEFFREASSGYNINAYFVAINITATLEHSTQAVVIAFFAAWLREPIANWWSFFIHFIMLTWICISWGFLIPMLFPPDNVIIVIGFFMAFCGLLISGALPPIGYKEIYASRFTEHLTAWLSPTRFFYEALIVGDLRCLPEQTGMTVEHESTNFPRNFTVVQQLGLAGHDLNSTLQSCNGWYWDVLPSLLIGLTVRFAAGLAMHAFNRAQQTKKPLLYEMKRSREVQLWVISMILVLFLMGFGTTFSYTMDRKHDFEMNEKLLEEYSSEDEFVQALLDEYNITSQEDLDDLLAASNFTLDDLSNFTIPDDIPIDVPFPTNVTTPSFGSGDIPNGTIPDDILINSTFVGF